MQNPINKEIRHYQEEIFMGLTLRQLICSVIAIGAAVLAYLTLEPVLGREKTCLHSITPEPSNLPWQLRFSQKAA